MVCKILSDFRLIDDEVGLEDVFYGFKWEISDNFCFIVVDCEGVNLSRKGVFIIIIVVMEDEVYIFDVFKLE